MQIWTLYGLRVEPDESELNVYLIKFTKINASDMEMVYKVRVHVKEDSVKSKYKMYIK